MTSGATAMLAAAHPIVVVVKDTVTDQCLTNPASIKTAAELVFRRSGIQLAEKSDLNTTDYIVKLTGYRIKNKNNISLGCVVSVSTALHSLRGMTLPYLFNEPVLYEVTYPVNSNLLTGGDDQSAQAKETAVTGAETAANEILKARTDMKAKFPEQYAKLAKGLNLPH